MLKYWIPSFKLILSAALAVTSIALHAKELSPEAQLRKIKLNLLGSLPTNQEYQLFETDSWSSIRSEKLSEYMAEDQFFNKLADRAMDNIRLDTDLDLNRFRNRNNSGSNQNSSDIFNSLNRHLAFKSIIADMIQKGHSWNDILASPNYTLAELIQEDLVTIFAFKPNIDRYAMEMRDVYSVNMEVAYQIVLGLRPRPEFPPHKAAQEKLNQVIRHLGIYDKDVAKRAATLNRQSFKAALIFLRGQLPLLEKRLDFTNEDKLFFDLAISEAMERASEIEPGNVVELANPALKDFELIKRIWNANASNDSEIADIASIIRQRTESLLTKDKESASFFERALNMFNSTPIQSRFDQTRYSRTAAFYRVFFCDEMRPVALGTNTVADDALGGLNFSGRTDQVSNAQISEAEIENPHVHEKCISCHRKLDPVNEQEQDPNKEITLVYDDENGKEYKIQIANQDELIPTVQKTEQYLTCQSRKLWAWVIGQDVPLTGDRLNQVKSIYKTNKGDLKSIIREFVQFPEFSNDDFLFQPTNIGSVKPLLNRCNSCHSDEPLMPSFTELPINYFATTPAEKLEQNYNWMLKIANETQFHNFGKMAKMPPKKSNWILTETDHISLGRWIWDLARDERGKPTLTEEQRDSIINSADSKMKANLSRTTAKATFSDTWKRFIEKGNLLQVIKDLYPNSVYCANSIDQGSKNLLGFNDIFSGSPTSEQPNLGFQSWYTDCIHTTIKQEHYNITQEMGNNQIESNLWEDLSHRWNLALLFQLKADVEDYSQRSVHSLLLRTNWNSLTKDQKIYWVSGIVEGHIGNHVLPSKAVQQLSENIVSTLDTHYKDNSWNSTLSEALKLIIFLTLNTEDFLTF